MNTAIDKNPTTRADAECSETYLGIREMVAALDAARASRRKEAIAAAELDIGDEPISVSTTTTRDVPRSIDRVTKTYEILMRRGAINIRIAGTLAFGRPVTATLQHWHGHARDWTDWLGYGADDDAQAIRAALLVYADVFHFGAA